MIHNNYKNITIYGDGGVASLVKDELQEFKTFVDGINNIEELYSRNVIVAINNPFTKKKIIETLNKNKINIISFISKSAIVSNSAIIENGSVILCGAIVNAGAVINKYSTIGSATVIGHDTVIGEYSSINMGSLIAGYCNIGTMVQIGMGTILSQFEEVEDRLCVDAEYQTNSGGMQTIRTNHRIEKSLEELKQEWGSNISIVKNKSGNVTPKINVTRKDKQ